MILIYAHESSVRLQYICRFIFKEQLGIAYSLTTDWEGFIDHDGARINYSDTDAGDHVIQVIPQGLLAESDIHPLPVTVGSWNQLPCFFETGGNFTFDIFSAIFYLITRYEEYLPYQPDKYGRYPHTSSLAYRAGFLHIPLVNFWLAAFSQELIAHFPELHPASPAHNILLTYDIDIAWSYKHKGLLRSIGGFLRSPSLERLKVWRKEGIDPYDAYAFLHELHHVSVLKPIYFFLVANKNGTYDKNISPRDPALQQLIRDHAARYKVGLHPSYQSNSSLDTLLEEKVKLEDISGTQITDSRQHYLKMKLPDTYTNLELAGITDEYSMGYGTVNGFRASIATSYDWFDVANNKITKLHIHPFCFMDSTSHFILDQSPAEAGEELRGYYELCKEHGLPFTCIFHNNILGTAKEFEGWQQMYSEFVTHIAATTT